PARLAALDVDRGTSCDRRQPRRHLAVLIETARRAPGIQEGLLGRLFSQSGVSQHAIGDSVDETPVCAIDAADGIGIAVAEPPPCPPVHPTLAATPHARDATNRVALTAGATACRSRARQSGHPGLGGPNRNRERGAG